MTADLKQTENGLSYSDVKLGKGKQPQKGNLVVVSPVTVASSHRVFMLELHGAQLIEVSVTHTHTPITQTNLHMRLSTYQSFHGWIGKAQHASANPSPIHIQVCLPSHCSRSFRSSGLCLSSARMYND